MYVDESRYKVFIRRMIGRAPVGERVRREVALSPFLFAMVMDRLTDEVRQESPWNMMFADDIVICSKVKNRWRGA